MRRYPLAASVIVVGIAWGYDVLVGIYATHLLQWEADWPSDFSTSPTASCASLAITGALLLSVSPQIVTGGAGGASIVVGAIW
jgi:hypothetical protein